MPLRFATVVFITRNGWKLFCLVTSTWWKIQYIQYAKSIQLMTEACWEGWCYVLRYLQFFVTSSFVQRFITPTFKIAGAYRWYAVLIWNLSKNQNADFFICCKHVIYSTAILYSFCPSPLPPSLPLRFVLLLYLNTVHDMLFDSIIVKFSCLAGWLE